MEKATVLVGRRPKPVLIIAIDCGSLSLQDEQNYGGIATIAVNLLKSLGKIDRRNKYILYSFAPIAKGLLRQFGPRMYNKVLWPVIGYKSIWLPLSLKLTSPHVFLALSQSFPRSSVPTLGFVYDLAFITHSDSYRHPQRLLGNTDELVKHSRHLVTISESSKKDLINRYHLKDRQVSVLFPGVSDIFIPDGPKYVDTHPYFLFVGALKKTKNIPKIIIGFYKFLRTTRKEFRFVLIGSSMELDPDIDKTITRLSLKPYIQIKGFVKTQDLPKYYRGAYAFVSPSLYEGFGLPILEAMACGCPVIVGDVSAMPEVVGNAGMKVPVHDTVGIANAMQSLVENGSFRRRLIKLGLVQANRFSSRQFARGILDCIYNEIIK